MTATPTVLLSYDSYAMQFQLNFKSGKPVYLQIVDQVRSAAAAGAIKTGESLPSIRPLAEELRVNRNTVAKAYAELESQGVIETIAGKGCFIRANNSPFKKEVRLQAADRGNRPGRRPGASPAGGQDEFLRIAEERFESFQEKRADDGPGQRTSEPYELHDLAESSRSINQLVRRYGRTDAVNGLSLQVAAGTLLRLLRPQRRRQDDHHQVPAESASADER